MVHNQSQLPGNCNTCKRTESIPSDQQVFQSATDEASYNRAIKQLKESFGDPVVTTRAYRLAKVSGKDKSTIRDYINFLEECLHAAKTMPSLNVLDDPLESQKLAERLPEWLTSCWACVNVEMKKEQRFPHSRSSLGFYPRRQK